MQTGSHGRRAVGFACALVAASLALACAHPVKRRDWSHYQGPGAEAFHAEEIDPPSVRDPLEPFNRTVSAVNHFGIVMVASPVGHVYRVFVPRLVRESVRDFAANLLWPRNLLANLLQARWRAAGTETLRFGINTTVGLAGIWDPALHWWGIEPRPEDFGQVFGAWGWRPSTFLMLPLIGPSTPRDAIGRVPDTLLDPATYFSPASSVLTFNELVDSLDGYERFVETSFDPYDDTRLVWTIARETAIEDGVRAAAERGDDTGAVQTLESVFLAPRDDKFWHKLETGRAKIEGTGRELLYSYRLRPGTAPIVFLVPGLGTHRLGQSSLALAEMAWRQGFSVAIVSNALCFEFMLQAASVAVPGHAPADARDLQRALTAVVKDLQGQHPDRLGKRVYMGYSLGAFHGFYLAAGTGDADALPFERYVLLDPPVSVAYALSQLDDYYNAPLAQPPERRAAEVTRIQRKAIHFAEASLAGDGSEDRPRVEPAETGSLEPSRELPFTDLEARYLIGLSFRRSLLAVLWISQQRHDLGVLRTARSGYRRTSAYEEMADYSWSEYLYAFVLPYYRDELGLVRSEEELVAQNDLHAIAERLRGNPKLRVFLNSNDLITRDEEIAWLRQLVGPERVWLFPTGGHLGNLHAPDVQTEIMDSIADLLP